jgi:hypothetical protein
MKVEIDLDIPRRRIKGNVVISLHSNNGTARSVDIDAVAFVEIKASDDEGKHKLESRLEHVVNCLFN